MFVILYHNEHAFDNAAECEIRGPYPSLDDAKAGLAKLVTEMNDPLFKIDPNPEASERNGDYAGFFYEDLITNERDEDIACEIWAEIVPLTAV